MNRDRACRTRTFAVVSLVALTMIVAPFGRGSRANAVASTTKRASFAVSSPVLTDGGQLPIRFTCDGASINPSIRWTAAPKGTRSFAVVMHHVAGPGDVHWYWVVYGLSTRVNHLDEASSAVGTNGTNSVNGRNEYTPPCSKGPGPKAYTLTVYALSAVPTFPPASAVSRDVLLAAIAHTTLASSSLTVMYSRQSTAADAPPPRPRRGGAAPDTTVPRN